MSIIYFYLASHLGRKCCDICVYKPAVSLTTETTAWDLASSSVSSSRLQIKDSLPLISNSTQIALKLKKKNYDSPRES